jgi:hypothetical protein
MIGSFTPNPWNQDWSCTRGEIEKVYLTIGFISLAIRAKGEI